MIDFAAVFIYFFAVIDPIGTVPVFIAVTKGQSQATSRKMAVTATVTAALVLLFFAGMGEFILNAMSIPLSAFSVAGGLILFIFALTMIFGESKPEEEVKLVDRATESAIFPLAIPSIAGPGAMLAAVLLTEKPRYSVVEQLQTAGVMLLVLTITLVLMLSSSAVNRIIGGTGASIISRVMGLIIASAATANVLQGIRQFYAL